MQPKTAHRPLFSYVPFLLGGLVMLLTVGCASSGNLSTATIRISESKKAISVARESNASTPKPVDLTNAEEKLAQANLAFNESEYLQATRLAEKATVDADCARIEGKAEKAKKDAEQMRQNNRAMRLDPERSYR